MRRATPKLREISKRLIVYETPGDKISEKEDRSAFRVSDKLRPHLATLMGNGGFRALLARALVLASEEVHWLRAVHVKSDGSLEGLAQLHAGLTPDKFFEGRVVLVAQLLGLLVAFVGSQLTARFVREIWPKFPINPTDFEMEVANEKTK